MLGEKKVDPEMKPADMHFPKTTGQLGRILSRIESIIKTAPQIATQTFDRQGFIRQWNSSAEQLYGYSGEQVIGKRIQDVLLTADSVEKFEKTLSHIWNTSKTSLTEQWMIRTQTNQQRKVRSTMFPVFENGRVKLIFCIDVDITVGRRIKQPPDQRQRSYKTLLETIPYGVEEIDTSGRIIFANKALHKIYGCRQGGLIGKKIFDFCPSEAERIKLRRYLADRAGEQLLPMPYETRILSNDGRVIDIEVHWDYIRNQAGSLTGFVSIIADTAERNKIKKRLRESEQKYKTVFEVFTQGILIADVETMEFTYGNSAICKMLGYSAEELTQMSVSDIHPKNSLDRVISKCCAQRNGEKNPVREIPCRKKDGTIIYADINTTAFSTNGKECCAIFFTEVTERRNVEMYRQLTTKILECVNSSKRSMKVLSEVLALIKTHLDFDAVGIRLEEGDDFPYYEVKGFSDDFVEAENYLCARDKNGQKIYDSSGNQVLECMCGNVLSCRTDSSRPFFTEGGSFWTNSTTELLASTTEKERCGHTHNRCNSQGYESVALIPLRCADRIVGLLQLNDTRKQRFTPAAISHLEGIGIGLGMALARIKAEQYAENLAKFPSENPNPILRIAGSGKLLYANSAAASLLKQRQGRIIPDNWQSIVREALASGTEKKDNIEHEGRTFLFVFTPICENNYVNVYGRDITKYKKAEKEILKLNRELERRVASRTIRLIRAHRQLLEKVEERKCLEKEILNISEREKKLIGRELHDSIGQQFAGIAFMIKVLEQRLTEKMPEEAKQARQIAKIVGGAMEQARALAKGLHHVDLEAGNLEPALRELAESSSKLFNVNCTLKCDKSIPNYDTETAVHLYRIAQEAITNAIKHGNAEKIEISLACGSSKSMLAVKNDGKNFPGTKTKNSGLGLQIMNHRVEMIGGSFDIRAAAEGGTILTCIFPNKKYMQ